jgi:hypothetical protein
LGGVNVPVNCTDVAAAVDVYNNAFDGCRIQTGSIPFNNSPSLMVTNGLQINTATVDRTASEKLSELKVNAYPNPFSDKINFYFVSPVRGKASLEIYNISGQRIASVFSGMIDAGIPQTVQYIKSKTIANSTLVYKLTVGDKAVYGKIQVVD